MRVSQRQCLLAVGKRLERDVRAEALTEKTGPHLQFLHYFLYSRNATTTLGQGSDVISALFQLRRS